MKQFKYVLLFISILFCRQGNSQEKTTDVFAEIGNKKQAIRLHLLEDKLPPALPDLSLPAMDNKRSAFKPIDKIDSGSELQAELKRMRKRYLPFLKNYAPEIIKTRSKQYLNNFDWRIASKNDQKDISKILSEEKGWETVQIPHYGPPQGRATTYYRKSFKVSEDILKHQNQFIYFKGVDYNSKVFLNGSYLGSHEGFFAPFEFNITNYLQPGENILLVQVENDFPAQGGKDKNGVRKFGNKIYASTGMGWDDPNTGWHHCPPGMGIYQKCYIEGRDPIHFKDIFVRPLLDENAIEVWYEINNFHEDLKNISLNINVFGQNFEEVVISDFEFIPSTTYIPGLGDLAKPQDWKENKLTMGYGANYLKVKLPIQDPKLWNNQTPYLYQLQTKLFDENRNVVDMQATTFGMRSFTQDTLSIPKGQMYLNGEKIKLRGANTMGYMQQDVAREDWDQLIDDILLAKICNMNFLRLTQRPVQSEIYEYANKLGMMLQTDLPLFGVLRPNLFAEGVKQAGEMERLVRNHPSNIMITYMNERFPNAEGHPQRSMSTSEEYERFYEACNQIVHHWNPDRVIKPGDGDYDPPTSGLPDNHLYNIWYNGQAMGLGELHQGYWQKVKPNWFYACGEFGSEALDNYSVIEKYWPKEWLTKNQDGEWSPEKVTRAQTNNFHYMWYPTPNKLKDWIEASQDHQAWGTRLVTEAFRRDNRMMSFAIHLFIDAWPAGWMKAIMDVDRNPKKAFYVYRDALNPLMVSLRTDRYHFYEGENLKIEAWLSNDLNEVPENYKLKWQLEKNGKVIKSSQIDPKISKNYSEFQGYIKMIAPSVKNRTKYQLRMALFDNEGQGVSESLIDMDIFPKKNNCLNSKVYNFSDNNLSTQLLNDLEIDPLNNQNLADVILISDFTNYSNNREEYDKMVEQGKKIVFLNLSNGDYKIGGKKIEIEKTVMGQYYFVNPISGHSLVKDFEPFDFKFWFDDSKNVVRPLLSSVIKFNDNSIIPILKTGQTTWKNINDKYAAVVEIKNGKGFYRVCQLELNNRIKMNPTAAIFIKHLLND